MLVQVRETNGVLTARPAPAINWAGKPVDNRFLLRHSPLCEGPLMPFSIRPYRRFPVQCAVMLPRSLLRE